MPIKSYSLSAHAIAEALELLTLMAEPGFAGISIAAAQIWKTELIKTPRISAVIGPLKSHRSVRLISPPDVKSSPESVKINVRVALESDSISIRVSGCRNPEKRCLMSTNKMLILLLKGPGCFSSIVSGASAEGSGLLIERHTIDERTWTRSPTSPSYPSKIRGGG
jgi:hypothetical protein